MKISLDAAMRARDVSQPTEVDELAAVEPEGDGPPVVSPPRALPGPARRPRSWRQPGQGSAGSFPDSS